MLRRVYDMRNMVFSGVILALCVLLAAAGCVSQTNSPPVQATATPTATIPPVVTPTPAVTISMPDANATQTTFLSIAPASLSDAEKQDVTYLQESEKLERDLYAKFAQQYTSVPVFRNLAQIAGIYMTADNVILQRYNITNPELNDPGKFTNKKLQNLYNTFVDAGSTSLASALNAAATSEDMHIADLESALLRTDNADVKFIYRQELAFSRNSLRALSQTITAFGGTYSPTYLTKEYYNALIGSPVEPVPLI